MDVTPLVLEPLAVAQVLEPLAVAQALKPLLLCILLFLLLSVGSSDAFSPATHLHEPFANCQV